MYKKTDNISKNDIIKNDAINSTHFLRSYRVYSKTTLKSVRDMLK